MRYVLGLDIGIASLGWCVLNLEKERIERMGVRTFTKAENPKDGSSLALPRRLARGVRRRNRRRAHRMARLRGLLVREGVLSAQQMKTLYSKAFINDPYTLRAKGLDEILAPEEWVRVLLHIAKRRGFKSNRKSDAKEKESGRLIEGINTNLQLLSEGKYRTVGEMMARDAKFSINKRNKGGSYLNTLDRASLEQEMHALFAAQRRLGNPFASERLEEQFCTIYLAQRPFADKNQIEKMVGKCTFEPQELRAPKNSYTAERFVLLSKVNNLKLTDNGVRIDLTPEQRQSIVALSYDKAKVTYKQIRKAASIEDEYKFVGLRYHGRGDAEKNPEETTTFVQLRGFHELKKAFTEAGLKADWHTLANNPDILDAFAYALTFYKTDEDIQEYLRDQGVPKKYIDAVMPVSFDKVQHLSIKAMRKLIPYLEQGHRYDEACEKAGYLHYSPRLDKSEKTPLLKVINREELRNPVVIRAITQARKVINAIIREYGSPSRVHVEIARDLTKPFDERNRIRREQENYQKTKVRLSEKFKEVFGFEPKSDQLLKFRLWDEQKGFCAYTQEYLDIRRLIEPGYAEVDHILPYSRSLDDSMSNKVLVKGEENRNKGNRTPCEYFGQDERRWTTFEQWVGMNISNWSKRQKLLRKSFNEKEAEEMKSRHLNDTRYISRYLSTLLKEQLAFADENDKSPVLMINGQMTAFLRAKWGLVKERGEGDLHHALDAAVVAAASPAMVKKLSYYSKAKELHLVRVQDRLVDVETGELVDDRYRHIDVKHFPEPWDHFRDELLCRMSDEPQSAIRSLNSSSYSEEDLARVKPIFVSRAPSRKASGPAHMETIRSARYSDEGIKVAKISLSRLKMADLENMVGKERDRRLYEALKERLARFGNDPTKAFAEPFYKPTVDRSQGPLVRGIKICSPGDSGVRVNKGIADNASMVKVNVYTKNKKYYLVPIYVADLSKQVMPNRAIVAFKAESEWTEIDDSFTFLFCLFPNDLIYLETKKEKILGYYVSCHRGTGGLTIESHDRRKRWEGFGVKTSLKFEKLQVDPLGNISRVNKEKMNR